MINRGEFVELERRLRWGGQFIIALSILAGKAGGGDEATLVEG